MPALPTARRLNFVLSFLNSMLLVPLLTLFGLAQDPTTSTKEISKMKQATFGGGCFWCTEAVFQRLNGVQKVVSGYSGGHVENPTYKQVTGKKTGHVEVIQVTYDPSLVEYKELLEVFWKTHDPTTKDRQGADVGPQYRSVVFYHDDEQKELAALYKKKLDDSKYFRQPIVTEIKPLINFYPAEDYHQNYFNDNPGNPYCQAVVASKVAKFHEIFGTKAKSEEEVRNQ
jgi:peptide-methionine (S)-S-oxide reductase